MFPRNCMNAFSILDQSPNVVGFVLSEMPQTLLPAATKHMYDSREVKGRFLFLSLLSFYHIIAIYLQIPAGNFSLVNTVKHLE